MTSPGKTSSRGVEDEPPPHGNSSPRAGRRVRDPPRRHGASTGPCLNHRPVRPPPEIGRPPGTAAPNYAWSLMAQVIAGFAPVAVSGSGRWPLGAAGAQRAADPDPGGPAVLCQAGSPAHVCGSKAPPSGHHGRWREVGEGSSTRPGQRPRAPRHWRSRRSSVPPGHARRGIQITRSGTLSSRLTDPVGDHIGREDGEQSFRHAACFRCSAVVWA